MYSQKAIELVEEYCRAWPKVFEFLSSNNHNDLCFETTLFPNEVEFSIIFCLTIY